jgi:hypothetical protein
MAMMVMVTLLLAFAQAAFATHTPNTEMRPDVVPLEPRDFSIATTATGEKRLLFAQEVANVHNGPLEVFHNQKQKCTTGTGAEGRQAYQRVYVDSNNNGYFERGTDTASNVYSAGCMTFHPRHGHMHFDNFNDFFLYARVGDVRQGSAVASAVKQTFCLADVAQPFPSLAGSPSSAYYTSCHRNSTQGLSVGWSDIYPNYTQGQYLVITGLVNGDYCFEVVTDPLNKILEANNGGNAEANNFDSVQIHIEGSTVTSSANTHC